MNKNTGLIHPSALGAGRALGAGLLTPLKRPTEGLPPPRPADLRRRLLTWFDRHQRPLPWRSDRDPYRIWVSEVMLQQTQVATVIPYFERFLQAFPNVSALAAAREEDVLRLWEGLGYYRRARDLHRAARILAPEHGDRLPDDPEVWARLPGIGRYTLGAVLSQAFDRRLPILEANSRRVLCRLFGRADDPRRGEGLRWLWQTAEELLPRRRVGDFNQALMEAGAVVCTPAAPDCTRCPLAGVCVARRLGRQADIPARDAAPETIEVREVAVVVRRGPRLLLVRRPPHGRWAGLWEFPHRPLNGRGSAQSSAAAVLHALTGIRAEPTAELPRVRHTVTRHHITLHGVLARYRGGRFRSAFYADARWVEPERLGEFPLSVPQRRLARPLLCPEV